MRIADANFVPRYVLNDDQPCCIESGQDSGARRSARGEVSSSLKALFSKTNLLTTDRDVLFEAFELLATSKLDFVDYLLVAYKSARA